MNALIRKTHQRHLRIKNGFRIFLILTLLAISSCSQQEVVPGNENYTLWYRQPAESSDEALPIGNGRLGAMIFGDPPEGKLQLNEETVWFDGPNNNIKPSMREVISIIESCFLKRNSSRHRK